MARVRSPCDAYEIVLSIIVDRRVAVIGRRRPPEMSTEVQRSRIDSGAPFVNRAPRFLLLTNTDIILRSRENSKVKSRGNSGSKWSLIALARSGGDIDDNLRFRAGAVLGNFSTRTLRAASVGSPTLV